MQTKKLILVTGATGAQGGSVAKTLLSQGKFAVRVLTRNPQSPKALALQLAGAQVYKGDMDDADSLRRALNGVDAVFGVTSYWEHHDKEYRHGKNLVNAVRDSAVEHFVFSTLDNYLEASNGTISVPHYDLKAGLKAYTKELGLPASFVQLSFYYENFFTWFLPRHSGNGKFRFGFPQGDTRLAAVSVTDLGPLVATIFDHPDVYLGRTVNVVGSDMTGKEYAAVLNRILGKDITYDHVARDEYAKLDFADAVELGNMFEVQRLYYPDHQLDLIESYGLNPSMQPFEKWVMNNKEKLNALLDDQLGSHGKAA